MSGPELTLTTRQVACMAGISERHVRRLADMGVITKPLKRGQWSMESVADYVRYLKQDDGDINATEERAKLYRAQRALKELELKEREGELIPVREMIENVGGMITNSKARLLAIPSSLSPYLEGKSGADIESQLTDAIYTALEELGAP